MKWLFMLIAMLAISASAADVSGNWKATIETPNGTMERTFVFKVEGTKLTGESSSEMMGKSEILDGKIEGDTLSFQLKMSIQDREMTAKYTGTVKGDVIELAAEIEGFDRKMEYTAKRDSK
jgi:hypothetical protein